jgi:hypothetical protein
MSIETPRQSDDVQVASTIETPNATKTAEIVLGKSKNREGFSTGQKIAGTALALGLLGGGAVGANYLSSRTEAPAPIDQNDGDNDTLPNATTEPTAFASPSNTVPLETAQPTPSASALETTKTVDKYTLNQLESMPFEQFNTLDFKDKAKYIKYLLEDSEKHLIYYAIPKTAADPGADLYKYNPLDIASETNTPQEIAMQIHYALQLHLSQPKSTTVGDYTLNTEKSQKALSAPFYDIDEPEMTPSYVTLKVGIENGEPAGYLKDRYAGAKEISPATEEVAPNGEKIKVRTLSLLDNGVERILKVTLRKLDDSSSIWQIYEQRK